MLKSYMMALTAVLLTALGLNAQVVTTSPSMLQVDSQDVVIYFHADQGSKGLANLSPDAPVYAHTGLITSASTSDADWKYATPSWSQNDAKYQMVREGENLYALHIGDIATFYGVPATSVSTIKKIAFVFRNADGSKTGKTATNGDIFVNVNGAGLQVAMTTNLDGTVVTPDNPTVKFTITSTQPANLSLGINGVTVAEKDNATEFVTEYTFTEPGNYSCYGNAKTADVTKSTNIMLAYTAASPEVPYPGGKPIMGPVANADGSVTFCFAAPDKTSVMLVGSWTDFAADDKYLMNRHTYNGQRYFWITIPDIDPTEQYLYYFLVDATHKVGDPYARLVLDPTNDKYISNTIYPDLPAYPSSKVSNVCLAVYQGNINDYDWQVKDFKPANHSNLIVYELLFRDFTGTEGQKKGNGTVRKAIEKLPYLKALGVNVIELMPINEFSGNNSWGYNPNFYMAPDKAYGTPDDYKEFIDLCHQNGMAVVLDMVFNQCDSQAPWYKMYYSGQNPMVNADAPHAWSVLNDWNQGHPVVRQHWKDVVKYWMTEYKIDGYRFDLVKGLGNNDSYANNGGDATGAFNQSRIDNMREIQLAMLEVNPDCIFINENLAGAQEENAMGAYGQLNWANYNNAGKQFAIGVKSSSGLSGMLATKGGRTFGTTVSYLESHDEQRLAYEQKTYGATGVQGNLDVQMRRLGCAAAQMLLAPGSHMIWQFSELGNDETTKDSNGGNATGPKRVLWDYYDDPFRRGLYDSYAQFIDLRMSNPELFTTDAYVTMNCAQTNWATGRTILLKNSEKEILTFINPNIDKEYTMTASFNRTSNSDYYIASCSYGTVPTFDVAAGKVTIPANSYVTIASNNVKMGASGVDEVEADDWSGETMVFSLDGTLMYRGADGGKSLPSGIYIVKNGNSAKKMVVK